MISVLLEEVCDLLVPSLLRVHIHTLVFAFSFDFVRQYTLADYGYIYLPLTHLCLHVNKESQRNSSNSKPA